MADFKFDTPIAFLVFNRPEATARVFNAIRAVRPPKLLVVADGPRQDRPGESDACGQVRAIIDGVDWPCEVLKNYSDRNLGCKRRISSGLDWVFQNVEEAIILEDDCLPDPSFFRFCQELLEKYRHDDRVMMISGDNFQFDRTLPDYSYYYSRYYHIWGWASWRRAWRFYDVDMKLWPQVRDGSLFRLLFDSAAELRHWHTMFDRVHRGEINTWDYQWAFSGWIQNGLTILPSVNLVSNIGFGTAATHVGSESRFADMAAHPMDFPLRHPPYVMRDREADAHTHKITLADAALARAVIRRLKRIFR